MSTPVDVLQSELRSILDTLPDRYDPVHASKVHTPCQFRLSGEIESSFHIVCNDGAIRAVPGVHGEPGSNVSLDARAFIDVCMHRAGFEDLIDSGSVEFSGRLDEAEAISWMLFLPPDEVVLRFEEIEEVWEKLPPLTEIPVTTAPTVEELREAARLHRPLMMKGALAQWAHSKWTPESLEAQFGQVKLMANGKEVPISELLKESRDRMEDARRRGATLPESSGYFPSKQMPPEMAAPVIDSFFDVVPHFKRTQWNQAHELFVSIPPAVTGLHRDVADGIVTAFMAPRRLRFFSPADVDFVYPFSSIADGFQTCHVDPVNVDLEKYPKFAEAKCITVDLEPGDLLFIPGGWFHHVVALDISFSLKFHLNDDWMDQL